MHLKAACLLMQKHAGNLIIYNARCKGLNPYMVHISEGVGTWGYPITRSQLYNGCTDAAVFAGYEPFCAEIKSLFGADVNSHDVKALFRKIAANPEAEVDWSEVH